MEKIGDTSLLSNEIVTMLSGHQTQLKVVDIRYIVTGIDSNKPAGDATAPLPIAEPFELGPVVDVVPYALARSDH